MHVLLVSNHGTEAALTQAFLPLEGISVSVAPSVDDAVDQLQRYDIDVVVYDFRLRDPAPDGIRARLRVGRNPPPILAIVPSGSISSNDAQARLSLIAQGVADAVLVRTAGAAEDGRQFVANLRKLALARYGLKLPEESFGRFRIIFSERRCFALDRGAWAEIPLPHESYELLEYLVFYRDRFVDYERILERLNAFERFGARVPGKAEEAVPAAEVLDEAGLQQLVRRTREQALTPLGLKDVLVSPPGKGLRFDTAACVHDTRARIVEVLPDAGDPPAAGRAA